jgi:hypothetical protein
MASFSPAKDPSRVETRVQVVAVYVAECALFCFPPLIGGRRRGPGLGRQESGWLEKVFRTSLLTETFLFEGSNYPT